MDFSRSNLRGTSLFGAHLQRATFVETDLRGAVLEGAFLDGAVLKGANLRGANLRGATLTGAYFHGARADDLTRWPTGFDWRGAGIELTQ